VEAIQGLLKAGQPGRKLWAKVDAALAEFGEDATLIELKRKASSGDHCAGTT